MNNNLRLVLATTGVFLLTMAFDANADIRVRCEARAGISKISVDGKNLAPDSYSTLVMSGVNQASSPLALSMGDELEADYSSNNNDVAAGAVKIGPKFIQGAQVTGKILNADGNTVISDTVRCITR